MSLKEIVSRNILRNISKDGVLTNKIVWSMTKPFPTNKGHY